MSAPIRVGIVGANPVRGWARDAHLAALRGLPQFALTAVSARTPAAAAAAAAAFGAPRAFDDSLALVRDPEVDVVTITVKVPEHRKVVLAALEAGKHVYCEWPLGRDLEEVKEMVAAVRPQSHAMTGLQALSAPAIRHAARLIGDGAVGPPRVLRVFGAAAAWGEHTQPHYAYLQDKSNGATLETIGGGHALAAVEALVGAYREVDARNSTLRSRVPVERTGEIVTRTCADHMMVLGLHEGGCVSTFEMVGGLVDRPALFEIIGETGWLRIVGATPGACQIASLRLEASVPIPPVPAAVADLSGPAANIAEAYSRFAEDLNAGVRTVPDFAVALRMTRLLEAIDRASRSGQRTVL
jgi:predicted dehydrogenase